jgi:hypothetical protein
MRLSFSTVVLAVFLLLFPLLLSAQEVNTEPGEVVVRELKDELLVYDNEYKTYVPFVQEIHSGFNTLNFWISRNEFYGYVLKFNTSPELCLFINQKLYRSYNGRGVAEIDLTSMDLVGSNKEFLVTFYHPNSAFMAVGEPRLIYKSPGGSAVTPSVEKVSTANRYNPVKRSSSASHNLFLLYFLGMFALYIVAKNITPALFASYFDIGKLFSDTVSDYSSAIKKSWSSTSILVVAINSLCIAFILVLLKADFQFISTYKIEYSAGFMGAYLRLIGLCLLYYLFKFSLLYLSGRLFKIKAFVNAHFFEFIRFSTIISVVLLSLLFLQYNTAYITHNIITELAKYLVLGLLVVLVIKISLVLNRSVSFRNLYLFSYLCATEIIPVFIVVKYFQIG